MITLSGLTRVTMSGLSLPWITCVVDPSAVRNTVRVAMCAMWRLEMTTEMKHGAGREAHRVEAAIPVRVRFRCVWIHFWHALPSLIGLIDAPRHSRHCVEQVWQVAGPLNLAPVSQWPRSVPYPDIFNHLNPTLDSDSQQSDDGIWDPFPTSSSICTLKLRLMMTPDL